MAGRPLSQPLYGLVDDVLDQLRLVAVRVAAAV
jgi:hypothetical protein